MVAAGISDVKPLVTRCARAGIELVAEDRGVEISAHVPESGALRHWLGRGRRGHGLLRLRPAIFIISQAVPGSADRLPSVGAGKIGLDDFRNHQSPVPGATSWTPQRQGQSDPRAHFHGQAEQYLDGAGMRPYGAGYFGGEWRG